MTFKESVIHYFVYVCSDQSVHCCTEPLPPGRSRELRLLHQNCSSWRLHRPGKADYTSHLSLLLCISSSVWNYFISWVNHVTLAFVCRFWRGWSSVVQWWTATHRSEVKLDYPKLIYLHVLKEGFSNLFFFFPLFLQDTTSQKTFLLWLQILIFISPLLSQTFTFFFCTCIILHVYILWSGSFGSFFTFVIHFC